MATKERKRPRRITDAQFEKIWKAAREGDDRKRCKRGHDLTRIENAHRSETRRTGRVRCLLCWRVSAGLDKPRKPLAKKAKGISMSFPQVKTTAENKGVA
ncbi:MAG: hypothetical protein ACHP8B_10830 [Terriglobales bacterium]